MKSSKLFSLSLVIIFGLFCNSCMIKFVVPDSEFLIADSAPYPFGFYQVDVYGDIVAWKASGKKGGYIFYKDLSTGEQHQISDDSPFHDNPSIYEDKIVWANTGWIHKMNGIYVHDISTGITTRVVSDPSDKYPTNVKIYGDIIVWHGNQAGKPIILSGFDLSTGKVFEISSSGSLHSDDIYDRIVVWGSGDAIWAKDLTTGDIQGPIDGESNKMGDSWWPHGVQIYDDLVVWQSQFSADFSELGPWGVYGSYLSTGEIFKVAADHSFHATALDQDVYGDIVLWKKSFGGNSRSVAWLRATDVSSGKSFTISEADQYGNIYGSIHENLVVYSRGGNIYGNYIIKSPITILYEWYTKIFLADESGKTSLQ